MAILSSVLRRRQSSCPFPHMGRLRLQNITIIHPTPEYSPTSSVCQGGVLLLCLLSRNGLEVASCGMLSLLLSWRRREERTGQGIASAYSDFNRFAAECNAVFEYGRLPPQIQHGVITLRVDLLQRLLRQFFQLGQGAFLCGLEFDQYPREILISPLRRQADVVAPLSGFPVGCDFVTVVHDRAQPQNQPVIEVLLRRVERAYGCKQKIPQRLSQFG